MKVYLVIDSWCVEYESGIDIKVFDDIEKAKIYFNQEIKNAKTDLEGVNYTIEEDDMFFSIYEEGEYVVNHINIYIQEKEVE